MLKKAEMAEKRSRCCAKSGVIVRLTNPYLAHILMKSAGSVLDFSLFKAPTTGGTVEKKRDAGERRLTRAEKEGRKNYR